MDPEIKKPISHSRLIELSQSFNLPYALEFSWGSSLKMTNHHHPWSLLQEEAEILFRNILHSNLKSGFEIATAFGISAIALGQAFKVTGGKLVTMDAYIEEHFNQADGYDLSTKLTKVDADGFKLASIMLETLQLEKHVSLAIGWSPTDTLKILSQHHSLPLDFIMIDGGHTADQVHADVEVLVSQTAENCLLAFHDFYCVGEHTQALLAAEGFTTKTQFGTGFDLVLYAKGNLDIIS